MTTERAIVPNIVRSKKGQFWIPPFPPHWNDWMGPYDTKEEAKADRAGLEETINGVEWQMMLVEQVDQFEEEWERRELKYATNQSIV